MCGNAATGTLMMLGTIGLSGCTALAGVSGPRIQMVRPGTLQAAATLQPVPVDERAWPDSEWWTSLADPQLDEIEREALAGNPSLSVAHARVDRAQAALGAARARLLPSVAADANGTRERFSGHDIVPPPFNGTTKTESRLALDFGYEFDFWGRNRAALAAAVDEADARRVDDFAARLVLSTAVAAAYVQLARVEEQLTIAREALRQRQQVYDLTDRLVAAGLSSRVELKQAETAVPATSENIAALEESAAVSRDQLAALMGQGPDRGRLIQTPALPQIGGEVRLPSQLPADLLGRRPDVEACRLRVEAAAQAVKVARAEFYPNVDLVAFLGFQSIGLSQLLQAGSQIAGIGPAVRLPLFEGGQLRSQLAGRRAEYDAAVGQYNQTLIEALREIADRLAASHSVALQTASYERAVASARDAYELSTQRYREGVGTYLTVLSAETLVLEQEHLGVDLRARALDDHIQLVKALGGGFQDARPGDRDLPGESR